MEYTLIDETCFDKVEQYFMEDGAANNEYGYSLGLLEEADQVADDWARITIPRDQARQIMLPYHIHGGDEIVPPSGLTVEEAYQWMQDGVDADSCRRHVERFVDQEIGRLILSDGPVRTKPDYEQMDGVGDSLVHLDGLHRMLALEHSSGPQETVEAYLARGVDL